MKFTWFGKIAFVLLFTGMALAIVSMIAHSSNFLWASAIVVWLSAMLMTFEANRR